MKIQPTVGRVVWYFHNDGPQEAPLAALVAAVHGDASVNLAVFDENGRPFNRQHVPLVQDGEARPVRGWYCTWMPFQIGQAKRHAEESASYRVGDAHPTA